MNIHKGTKNALLAKLNSANKSCDNEKYKTSSNNLKAFINECEAQSGKKLTEEQANYLIQYAESIIAIFNSQNLIRAKKSENNNIGKPEEFTIIQNYPNPFNPTTTIQYGIATNGKVSVQIYDILGQLVTTLVNTEQSAGMYAVIWNGTNDRGELVPSGTYISRIAAGSEVKTMTMMYLK